MKFVGIHICSFDVFFAKCILFERYIHECMFGQQHLKYLGLAFQFHIVNTDTKMSTLK